MPLWKKLQKAKQQEITGIIFSCAKFIRTLKDFLLQSLNALDSISYHSQPTIVSIAIA